MHCPRCGHEVQDDARFCPDCGERLAKEVPGAEHVFEPQVPGTDEARPRATAKVRRVLVVACALAALALTAAGVFHIVTTIAHHTTAIPVTFTASLAGYDDHASRVPVHITGTTEGGEDVDLTTYLARSGVDIELARGSYTISVLGSPITGAGLIYRIPTEPLDFTVASPAPGEESYTVTEVLTFTPRDAAEVTDAEIEEAVDWARRDELSDVDADALDEAARDRRERARAGENVDTDLARPALPGDVSA